MTINNLEKFTEFSDELIDRFRSQHPVYPLDMILALNIARMAHFHSCVLTGFRTPSPYAQDEVAEICVKGTTNSTDFQRAVMGLILKGPDDGQ